MTDLAMLAEQCEQATGPNRELDARIAVESGQYVTSRHHPGMLASAAEQNRFGYYWPDYTASLDAAMTLVPEGWRVGFEQGASCDRDPSKCEAWLWPLESTYDPDWQLGQETQHSNPDGHGSFAATPALALTAACLRAMAG